MARSAPLFAFFGTPKYAVYVLGALERAEYLPALVVCAPDRPAGRGQHLQAPAAKEWALARGIEVAQPEKLDGDFIAELGNTQWDVFLTAAYGKLMPKALLELPERQCLNVHPSLLPKFRGASPVISAILQDERQTGVSVMVVEEKMDAGPMVAQARIEIDGAEWPLPAALLSEMLFTEGGNLLAEILPQWLSGEIEAAPQEESAATFTTKLADSDALVDLSGNPREQYLKIRAFDENPRAHLFAKDKSGTKIRVTIADATYEDGKLALTRVIPEGRKEVSWEEFLRAGNSLI